MKSNFNATIEQKKETMNPLDELIASLNRSQELGKALISSTEYILWLENFTVQNPSFEDDCLYYHDEIPKEDSNRISELHSFFDAITDYAERNFIPLYYDEFGADIFIKFNNIGYKIGEMCGQGSITYCERVDITSDNIFIDFNDIMNNKKQKNVDLICEKLASMSNIIEELLKLGVSEEAIDTNVQNCIENIRRKNF